VVSKPKDTPLYRFGPFLVDPSERLLRRQGTPISLTPKAFDLLLVLVENAGHLLEKDELLRTLWSDTFVEEANLSNNISQLRKALGETEGGGKYIETVPRRGYRFIEGVTTIGSVDDRAIPQAATAVVEAGPAPSDARRVEDAVLKKHWPAALAVTVAVIAVVAAVTLRRDSGPIPTLPSARFIVQPPPGTFLVPPGSQPIAPAMSPDGKRLAFRVVRGGETLLAIRSIDAIEAEVLAGTERASWPFWSPDSRVIAFFADSSLKKISAAGGAVLTICQAGAGLGGTWNRNGTILFASRKEGILRVSATGGQPTPVIPLHSDEAAVYQHPQFLPDGDHFIYFAAPDSIYLGSVDGGTPSRVLTTSGMALYAPPGFLLFVQDRTLFAQRFDVDRARVSGDPVPLAENVRTGGPQVGGRSVGGAAISVSENGVLAYRMDARVPRRLAWFDRSGRVVGSVGPLPFERYIDLELSPDGNRVAVSTGAPNSSGDIWVVDVADGHAFQMTFNRVPERRPVWSPDGSRLAFYSQGPEAPGIYQKMVTGERLEELLVASKPGEGMLPSDWIADGLVYDVQDNGIWLQPVARSAAATLVTGERLSVPDARFSPNAQYVAFTIDQSGKSEVIVQNISTHVTWGISHGGGSQPRWRRDGKELFFLGADGNLMAVPVDSDAKALRAGVPQPLFQTGLNTMPDALRSFGVTPNGQRFLVSVTEDPGTGSSLVVVSNWQAALKP
jgi:DNA-binding winged helix-turn-helix (wHTH) protein/Tol biopolymer transport system component